MRGLDGRTRVLHGNEFEGARPVRGDWLDLTWSGIEGEKKVVRIVSAQRLAWEEAKRANFAQAEALRRQLAEQKKTGALGTGFMPGIVLEISELGVAIQNVALKKNYLSPPKFIGQSGIDAIKKHGLRKGDFVQFWQSKNGLVGFEKITRERALSMCRSGREGRGGRE